MNPVIVFEGDRAIRNSDAVIAIRCGLGWRWRALTAFTLVPRALCDRVYRRVARNRCRLFGRRETCWVSSPAQWERML